MDNVQKHAIVEEILTRAAEQLGDITEAVMAVFYQEQPAAQDVFKQHRPVDTGWLEAGMVEQTLYCFMDWFKSAGEIRMAILGSVPHHVETLNVAVEHYHTLLEATATVVANTIPPANTQELAVWQEVGDNLHAVVDTANQNVFRREATQ